MMTSPQSIAATIRWWRATINSTIVVIVKVTRKAVAQTSTCHRPCWTLAGLKEMKQVQQREQDKLLQKGRCLPFRTRNIQTLRGHLQL
mmetsp:Transcript_29316/g.63588  ORF Transcript_29316/g.63588 Transcript_29316/m.63588 type:complete len:88 (+) Transcript_29316:523-786(+)